MGEEDQPLEGLGPVNEHSTLAGRPSLIKNTCRAQHRAGQCCGQEMPEPTHTPNLLKPGLCSQRRLLGAPLRSQ